VRWSIQGNRDKSVRFLYGYPMGLSDGIGKEGEIGNRYLTSISPYNILSYVILPHDMENDVSPCKIRTYKKLRFR
jgi:hypothetical protein